MLFLDLKNGVINLDDLAIAHPKMLAKNFPNLSEKLKISTYLIKKSTIQRIEINEYWSEIFIESVATAFNYGKIEKIDINFIVEANITESSISEISITKKIQKILNDCGETRGLSEINFKLNWGKIKLIYDIKASAFTLSILYT